MLYSISLTNKKFTEAQNSVPATKLGIALVVTTYAESGLKTKANVASSEKL